MLDRKEVITSHKRSLRRLCFYTCLSVHRGSTWAGTPRQVPPWSGTPPPPPGQVHPSWQVHPPGHVHPPAGTPPWSGIPLAGTPPLARYTPRQVHPPMYIPPGHCMLGDTGNKRMGRILLDCILVFFMKSLLPKIKMEEITKLCHVFCCQGSVTKKSMFCYHLK